MTLVNTKHDPKVSDVMTPSPEERSPSSSSPDSPAPSSPSSPKLSSSSKKEVNKMASKSFGYLQRSIELVGRESPRLAGARDFSNTLHWTQAMKFLKEQGYIHTKTGHGTTVAEQYQTLGGLELAFQDKYNLENFPLPRLSKAHMERLESKSEEPSFGSAKYDFPLFTRRHSSDQPKTPSFVKPPKIENCILVTPLMPSEPTFDASAGVGPVSPSQTILNPSSRRTSAPELGYSLANAAAYGSRHQIFDYIPSSSPSSSATSPSSSTPSLPTTSPYIYSNYSLPPLAKILPNEKTIPYPSEQHAPKCSNIHDILDKPVTRAEEEAKDSLDQLRQAADALLLHNFSQKALEEPTRKRMPPASSSVAIQGKRSKIDHHEDGPWRFSSVVERER